MNHARERKHAIRKTVSEKALLNDPVSRLPKAIPTKQAFSFPILLVSLIHLERVRESIIDGQRRYRGSRREISPLSSSKP